MNNLASIIDELSHFRYIRRMKKVWDRLGIAFSTACVAHCLLVAFLPILLPALTAYTHSSWIHVIFGFVILLTSPMAFIPGYKKHGLTWILKLAMTGLSLICLGLLLEGQTHDQVSHGVSILGSIVLVFSHVKNLQHSARHKHQCC
jgi:hypothetical protein